MMDEPFDGFDLRQTRDITCVLRKEVAKGRTLVLAIHQFLDFRHRLVILAEVGLQIGVFHVELAAVRPFLYSGVGFLLRLGKQVRLAIRLKGDVIVLPILGSLFWKAVFDAHPEWDAGTGLPSRR